MTTPVLSVEGIEKRFGDIHAVRGVGFSIDPGETYGLLGPNGAGKTTSISIIAGLLDPDAGRVTVAGEPLTTRTTKPKRAVGLVPQELAIYPDLTARENLRFFGRLYDLSGDALGRRIDRVLDVVGLSDRADDPAKEYSGGMKRRLNIGVGLLHEPSLLILDEPTVGVDPQSRNAILESVEHLSQEGMAVLYTTHYMEEAERLCDRVGIIDDGEIKAEGDRRQLVSLIGEKDRVVVEATGPSDGVVAALEALPGVAGATTADGRYDLLVQGAASVLPSVFDTMSRHDVTVTSLQVIEPDLEAVFLHLTGKALRD
ncbi:MAG TPA: ABC transporter ATP-binding protein [Acidimicrobiia bacterium]|nr:ABC transporter ATP-binding protein [Acidimicrobiia bacterium]